MSEWTEIIEVTAGEPHGHVAGHQYHDVSVTIERREIPVPVTVRDLVFDDGPSVQRIRAVVLETWGSSQGYSEERGRNRVVAIAETLDSAVRLAGARARTASVNARWLVQALSDAHSEAFDELLSQAESAGADAGDVHATP